MKTPRRHDRRRPGLSCLGILLGVLGCQPSSPHTPKASSVIVGFSNPASIDLPPVVNLAVVFTYGDLLESTTVVPGVDAGATYVVPLVTPRGDWETGLNPVETVTFPSLSTMDVYRPRLVLYEDTNQDQTLSAGDHVFAIDTSSSGASVASVLDLETTLSRMTFEESQAYYAASGGIYSAFLRVMGSRGFLQLVDASRAGPLTLKVSDSPIPGEHLACGRDSVFLLGDPLTPSQRITVQVDAAVDAAGFCGATLPDCTSVDLASVAPPEVTAVNTEGHRRVAMCRQTTDLQTLVVQSATLTCANCTCSYDTRADVWVAKAGLTPAWWPCGTTVADCTSSLPLYSIDPTCVQATP